MFVILLFLLVRIGVKVRHREKLGLQSKLWLNVWLEVQVNINVKVRDGVETLMPF